MSNPPGHWSGGFLFVEDGLSVPDTNELLAATGKHPVYGLDETRPSRSANPMYSVGVYGATGYAGQVLMSILARHPNVRIAFATSENSKETIDGIGLVAAADAPLASVDAVFLCLPH